MQDILYCFDKNYNEQAITSIYSLLENSSKKLTIHVLHNEPNSLSNLIKLIDNHEKLEKINLYMFKNDDYNFPKIDGSHVSKATYFRMFIEDYIDVKVKNILYVDPDVVCLNSFNEIIENICRDLNSLNKLISVKTEHICNKNNKNLFDRLNISNKYFNAGIMVINYEKWVNSKIKNSLVDTSKEIENNIVYWDQDVMNKYLDGEYLELPMQLNQHPFNFKNSMDYFAKNTIFLHYSGKNKPWNKKGFKDKNSVFYKKFYEEVFKKKLTVSRSR